MTKHFEAENLVFSIQYSGFCFLKMHPLGLMPDMSAIIRGF